MLFSDLLLVFIEHKIRDHSMKLYEKVRMKRNIKTCAFMLGTPASGKKKESDD